MSDDAVEQERGVPGVPAGDLVRSLQEVAVEAAVAAGRQILEHRSELLRKGVRFKGPIDLVTEADRLSEAIISRVIRSRFPDHDILSEESGASGGGSEYRWIVDPLDGTTNFAHGLPVYAVSVAVEHRGDLLAGAVYAPATEELFTAARGLGATYNGKPARVSEAAELERSLLATGFSYDVATNEQNNLDHLRNFTMRAQGLRRLGSAALDLCWVGVGWLDGFWEYRLHPWDVAAGLLFVEEAGGRTTGFHGEPLDLRKARVHPVASNGRIHEAMLQTLKLGRTGMVPERQPSTSGSAEA